MCLVLNLESLAKLKVVKFFFLHYLLEVLWFCILHFRSVIHFKLIFVKDVETVSRFLFLFLHVVVQLFTPLVEKLSLLRSMAFAPLSEVS